MTLASGPVAMGSLTVTVDTIRETATRSLYRVTGPRRGGQPFPGEVRVGVESVFLCLTCRRVDCIHADAVRRFVAAQPLDATGTAGPINDRPF